MRYFIGDTETTGLGPTRKACDIALLEIDTDLQVTGQAEALLNPGKPINPAAMAIHGITDEMVADQPSMEQWIAETLLGRIEEPCTLIGYRVAFDKPLLEPILNIVHTFDVLTLAQTLVRETKDHKLQTLREYYGLEGGQAHRALGDVITTHQLLQVLIPMSGRTLAQHCATPFQFVHRMPWGQHKSKLLIDLPSSYRLWLMGLDDLDPNLRKSLDMVRKTDLIL